MRVSLQVSISFAAMNPSIRICPDHEAVSSAAAHCICKSVANKPDLLLCAAGGSTPLRTYDLVAEAQSHAPKVFSALRVLKLDEWGGLEMSKPGSCEEQLQSHLIDSYPRIFQALQFFHQS